MTRVFENCLDAIKEIERTLFEFGTVVRTETMQDLDITSLSVNEQKKFDTLEIVGYDYVIKSFDDKNKILEYLNLPIDYCRIELNERISPELINPGISYKEREIIWNPFLTHNKGRFSYTYNERIREQKDYIINELHRHPNSRQAIISIYNPTIDIRKLGIDRVPCSMYYQFLLRENKLSIIYVQRSADFKTHIGNDIWLAISLLQEIAQELQIEVGDFHHYIGSLHAYRKDMEGGIF